MSIPIIRVVDVWKRYRLGGGPVPGMNLREAVMAKAAAHVRWWRTSATSSPAQQEFWALQGVSLEVERGEILGIIGSNGAGKTTLLKILARITAPSKGRVELRGRIASLLEVGTGFHPELSGRENVYLSGTILGMRRKEIVRQFDAIVAFAEVERFIDTPVKRYSSGMYMRLAFAVAAHLQPDILLVDEVLAVGDAAFQRKCLGKMGDVAHAGKTVLFVSHNLAAVERLCTSVVVLADGRVVRRGTPREMISRYLGAEHRPAFRARLRTGKPQVLSALLCDEQGNPLLRAVVTEPIVIVLRYVLPDPTPGARLGIGLLSPDGIPVWTSNTSDVAVNVPSTAGLYEARIVVAQNTLLAGEFHLATCLWNQGEIFDLQEPALSLTVDPGPSPLYSGGQERKGFVQVSCDWRIRTLEQSECPADEGYGTEATVPQRSARYA